MPNGWPGSGLLCRCADTRPFASAPTTTTKTSTSRTRGGKSFEGIDDDGQEQRRMAVAGGSRSPCHPSAANPRPLHSSDPETEPAASDIVPCALSLFFPPTTGVILPQTGRKEKRRETL